MRIFKILEKKLGIDASYYTRGGIYTVLTYMVQIAVGFVTSILIARLLPREVYGGWKYVLSVVGTFGILALPGMGTAMTNAIARGFDGAYRVGIRAVFTWSLLGSAALAVASFLPLRAHSGPVRTALLALAPLFPLYAVCGLYGVLLLAKQDLRRSFIYGTIYRIALALGTVVSVFVTKNLTLFILIIFAADILSRGIMTIHARRFVQNKTTDPGMIRYGKSLTWSSFLPMIGEQIDRLIIPATLGLPGLALYGVATMIPDQAKEFFASILNLSLPKLSRWQENKNQQSFIWQMFWRLGGLSVIGVALYAIVANPLMRSLFPNYPDAAGFSAIYALTLVVFPTVLLTNWFQAQRMTREIYIYNIGSALAQIASTIVLVPLFGIWGAVGARAIARASAMGIAVVLFMKRKRHSV